MEDDIIEGFLVIMPNLHGMKVWHTLDYNEAIRLRNTTVGRPVVYQVQKQKVSDTVVEYQFRNIT